MTLPTYAPMLATRWSRPFSDPEWAFEVKWDGVRAVAHWNGSELTTYSRRGRRVGETYPELSVLEGVPPCILDGEIVAFDAAGKPSFGVLQQRMNLRRAGSAAAEWPVSFMAFDLLYLTEPLITSPWSRRRAALESLELPSPFLVPEPVLGDGEALWDGVGTQELEGMVAKRVDSAYHPGTRSPEWRKVSRVDQVRAVVGGYLPGERSRMATFGSLLLGLVDGERLRYIGSVGTGFTGETLRAIRSALDEMTTADSPFHDGGDVARTAVYVEPSLTALVEFKEWTHTGKLRAPAFKGFTDNRWESLTWDSEGPPEH
ncbi:MAG: hypothetical protein HKN74_03185 [Acidimicrobiia bacterium]|nr:hypothetical protein [Acidimicrobiia bacterium]